eukprot:Sspe_Gene.114712::Locus_100897_Transcript_2_2_Confidence_0.667_Length_1091::g.114712::m.114712/K09602/OTUB1; ubiquitin thioesterase protein OTUB1
MVVVEGKNPPAEEGVKGGEATSADYYATPEAMLATTDQENSLLAEQQEFPRVGDMQDIATLQAEYSDADPVFITKLSHLPEGFSSLRRIRRDGNCFLRAFFFSMLEGLLAASDTAEVQRVIGVLDALKPTLVNRYNEHVTEFHDILREQLVDIKEGRLTLDSLVARFRSQEVSDYVVYYGRFAASNYIQENHFLFEPFLGVDVATYCQTQVEAVGCECDQESIIALTNVFGVGVRIMYLDRSPGERCNTHDFPEDRPPSIFLLYRPGHYDLLYPK